MKIELKSLVVLGLLLVITLWAVNIIRSRNYSGDHLSFAVGSGTVTIDNPSSESIPVQLVGTTTRTYNVTSNIEGVSGRSTREGSGRTATQLFTFELPSGSSEFSVEHGTEVIFTADSDTPLTAIVRPISAGATRNTIIALIVAIVGTFYYISSTMNHRWINFLRGKMSPQVKPVPVFVGDTDAHGRPTKGFGDNITRKHD